MKIKITKLKIIISSVILIFMVILFNLRNIYNFLPINLKTNFKSYSLTYYENLSDRSKILLRVLNLDPFTNLNKRYSRNKPVINNLNNDYNSKFLPKTQFEDFEVNIFKVKFSKKKNEINNLRYGPFNPFYIQIHEDKIFFINSLGEILISELKNFYKKNTEINFKKIDSNLNPKLVMGTLIYKNNFFISYKLLENKCQKYKIAKALINFEELIFEDIFVSSDCGKNLRAGAMSIINHQGSIGLLATMGGEVLNKPTNKPQLDSSDIGKTLFINLENYNKIIFSSGHRNPQGLLNIDNKNILSTEHGPYGGDEINKIIFGENYGWPIASYGMPYKASNKFTREQFKKSHEIHNFKEPIFSFIPSIGISQIIKLPNSFSKKFQDNFLLSSLNNASLYRIKFSSNFEKVIFMERIFVGKRIRDLKFDEKNNSILLALEDFHEVMTLKVKSQE